jgi:biotin-(acetyl-CoA carboxylase) ligase
VAFHLDWPAGLRVEGARCGRLLAAATDCMDGEIPDWLVLGLTVQVSREIAGEPGEHPDETDLRAEGIDLAGADLLSAWARHTLSGIARWEDEGLASTHRDWIGRAWGLGKPVTVASATGRRTGTFQGLDERGGILLKSEAGTVLVPLTQILERR